MTSCVPDRDRDVADGRLADALSVHQDLGPRRGVDRHRAPRPLEPHGRGLARRDLHGTLFPISERVVDEFEVVTANRQHDPLEIAAPDAAAILEHLHVRRHVEAYPSRSGRLRVPPIDTTSDAVRPLSMRTRSVSVPTSCCITTVCVPAVRSATLTGASDVFAVDGDRCAERIGAHQKLASSLRRSSELEVPRHLRACGQRDRNPAPFGGRPKLDHVLACRQLDAERRDAVRVAVHEHGDASRRRPDRERAGGGRARGGSHRTPRGAIPSTTRTPAAAARILMTMRGEHRSRAASLLRVARNRAGRFLEETSGSGEIVASARAGSTRRVSTRTVSTRAGSGAVRGGRLWRWVELAPVRVCRIGLRTLLSE